MGDTAHAELGFTHAWNTQEVNADSSIIAGGLYYDPVKQLTIGAEASYSMAGINTEDTPDGSYRAALVTVFRF